MLVWAALALIALVLVGVSLLFVGTTLFFLSDIFLRFFHRYAYFVPSRARAVGVAFERISALRRRFFYELGSGDGRVLRLAARRFPHLDPVIGYELNPVLVALSRFLNIITRSRAKVRRQDFFSIRLMNDSLVYFFLMPTVIASLKPTLTSLKRATVVSYGFDVPYLVSYLTQTIPGSPFSVYVYEIP